MGEVPVELWVLQQTAAMNGGQADPDALLWLRAHTAAGTHDCDGWHFVTCGDCGGSGRVSWFVTIARIPRWVVKGVRHYGWAMQPETSPDGWTWWQRFGNYLNIAFLADIKARRR